MKPSFKLSDFDLDPNILGKGYMAKIYKAIHK